MARKISTGVLTLSAIILLAFSPATLGQVQAPGWEMRVCADPNNMPYTNEAEEGFENRIAEIIADELGAELSYMWYPRRRKFIQQALRSGQCDMIMGIADGNKQVLTTLPYYRSSFVFVYPENANFDISSFDDPELQDLKIGVQIAAEGGMAPPNTALANRGMIENMVGFPIISDYDVDNPLSPIVTAVAKGDVDLAIVWGPIAGYFAQQQERALRIVPVAPKFEPPSLPMVFSIAIGLRHGDRDFEYLLDRTMVKRWDDIQAVLKEYGVPLEPLSKPRLSLKEVEEN